MEVEKSVPIVYLVHEITVCRADIVVDGKFVLELGTVKNKLCDGDRRQSKKYKYMEVLKMGRGVLINFRKTLEVEEIGSVVFFF